MHGLLGLATGSGFSPAPHDDVLHLLVMTAVLLVTARLMGEVAIRLRQPPVVGEIIAGVVLGPSMLSAWIPWVADVALPSPVCGIAIEALGNWYGGLGNNNGDGFCESCASR